MTSPDSDDSDLQASLNAYRHGNSVTSTWPDLNILVPLLGRQLAYVRFLDHLTSAASGYAGRVHVRVGLYANTSGDYQQVLRFSDSYRRLNITLVKMEGVFSRAGSLAALAAPFSLESLLIFMDVDLVLTQRFLYRAASNVGSGRAYFPVCFSQFSPFTVCYGRPNCTVKLFDYSPEAGSWRVYGFGLLAITGGDLKKAGGINTEMVGWGGEDVDFYKRCKNAKLDILRAPDTGLLHEYHEQGCGLALSPPQKEACSNSRGALYGYAPQLTKILNDIEMTINDTRRADFFVH
ncbi:chondroitin sulfate synthase 3-like [Littorina saxatilis]